MNTKKIIIKLFEKEHKSNLTIYHTSSEDEATYVCKITSGIGSVKSQAKLRVISGKFDVFKLLDSNLKQIS